MPADIKEKLKASETHINGKNDKAFVIFATGVPARGGGRGESHLLIIITERL